MYRSELELDVFFSFKEVVWGVIIMLVTLVAIMASIGAMYHYAYPTPVLQAVGCAG